MRIISWNINGLNASLKKGFIDFIQKYDADIYCFQETKVSQEKLESMNKKLKKAESYETYWNCAQKKGYSGVLCMSKEKPLSVIKGLGESKFDQEGRLLTLEYDDFYLINGYLPNAGRGLPRLDYKIEYMEEFMKYLNEFRKEKHVILTGDLNVAHKEKDLANPDSNHKTAGFTDEEREIFTELLEKDYVDTFREFTKESGHYTFWSYRGNARARNVGWRLDYFIVDKDFMSKVENSTILSDVKGSDHAPIELKIE